ncbi:hypothetical protein PRIPAC_97987 [Pristionchus pacificus]|uniref:Uncharacterized protein n=1 Tax=Pristionchus pacificus TaxID=54126 RepID=A0A2A6CGM6_PRIPA|nr:hypothetical protein PRIPAC_97987 [Pristionchus pacificus]|eukprot:PDM77375.1 hypothetical protein PRIPAC_33105 [Pristionchus pacificus]
MPHGQPVNYEITTFLRCFARERTTWHIALWEDDSIPFYRRDALIDWRTYDLIDFYASTATKMDLGGMLLDQPWDGVTEPYLYVQTNCSHGYNIAEFCLELEPVWKEDGINNIHDIADLFGPDFQGLTDMLKPCSYFQDVANMRDVFR